MEINNIDSYNLASDIIYLLKPYMVERVDYSYPEESGSITTKLSPFGVKLINKIDNLLKERLNE